jgi:hypothetical protein
MQKFSYPNHDLQSVNDKMKAWFDETIATLVSDQFIIETNVASPEKKRMYEAIVNKDEAELHAISRNSSTVYFIKAILQEYILEIKSRGIKLNKLAFDFNASKVLVWTEVFDDDESAIDALILSEAKINANHSKYGFHISTTLVEQSDKLPVPEHYKEVNLKSTVGFV